MIHMKGKQMLNNIKKILKKSYKVIIIVICLIIFIAILENILEPETLKIDTIIYNLVVLKMRNNTFTNIFKILTNLRWSICFNCNIYNIIIISKK